ncbi:TetR/AcrR family transcriptional regulator [Alicyclobacillus cycloheptanicus]|jgi:AcrR family transcriptional regulator|uniref:AcrR family transcriptional regulator n=1 Tax=Alicyclobacillus cycloheptanicus TaxID=1457 RepID=A0ABT9XM56_9BACL|nr:TetR/AcrR family transcriptional regulator [Alicyclobacillus cycloheptanicus]MDQ0191395.1 AcrR family transcriptional regulator [Alicyclobacillus cycloheptanicus]WDM00339.1 TetR/AcrR family transcriptional regulator [Alicyclobacillus cycloheptanicus]
MRTGSEVTTLDGTRRDSIVEAARKSLSLFGYKGTTMDQIARMANVSKGSIYTFFTSKEELFDLIVQETVDEMESVLQASVTADKPVFLSLHQTLSQVLQFRQEHELLAKLYHEMRELGTAAANDAVQRVEERILSFIERLIREAVDRGQMKPCDPRITAFLFMKFYIALVVEWSERNPPLDNETISKLFQFYFVKGLA